jgi:hypothetical protein
MYGEPDLAVLFLHSFRHVLDLLFGIGKSLARRIELLYRVSC